MTSRSVDEPHDRLTRLCDAMLDALQTDPEFSEPMRCAIFLTDEHGGGMVHAGYEDDGAAIADLIMHLKAIFEANGKKLVIVPLGQG